MLWFSNNVHPVGYTNENFTENPSSSGNTRIEVVFLRNYEPDLAHQGPSRSIYSVGVFLKVNPEFR